MRDAVHGPVDWSAEGEAFTRVPDDVLRGGEFLREKLFNLVVNVGDREDGSAAAGIEEEPCLVDGVSEGFDVSEDAGERRSGANVLHGSAAMEGEVNLSDMHVSGSLCAS